jgi:hypothetical protein
MSISRLLVLLLCLQSCSIGYLDRYRTKTSNNSNYSHQYSYDKRFYTKDNISLLTKELNNKQVNNSLIKRDDAINTNKRIEYSNDKLIKETKDIIDAYIMNYKSMVDDYESQHKDSDRIVSQDYFNLSEYDKKRPVMNIAIIKYLETNKIMPMTDEIAKDFIDYYQFYGDNMTQNASDNFNAEMDNNTYENKDLYKIIENKQNIKINDIAIQENKLTKNQNENIEGLKQFY